MNSNKMDIWYLRGYKFVDQDKPYQKETRDVQTKYSIIFSLSSNQNCQTDSYTRSHRHSHSGTTRQALSAHLSGMRAESIRGSQLDPTQDPGSESGQCPLVDYLPVSQSVLCSLSRYPYRRFGTVSPLSEGDSSFGPLCLSTVPGDDRLRSGSTPCSGLENGQKHRQIFSGTRLWSTRLSGITHFGRGRNLHPKRSPLLDRRTGLSDWPCGLYRQRSKGQNPEELFQSFDYQAKKGH